MSDSLKTAVGVLFICIQSVSCSADLSDFIEPGPVDISGYWSITEEALSDVSGPCYSQGDTEEYTVEITQNGDLLILHGAEGLGISGVGLAFLSGHTVGINWSNDETTIVGELEVSSDENSMEGDLEFTRTGPGEPCSGTIHITAVRGSAPDPDPDPADISGDWSFTEEALGDVSGSCYSPGQTEEYTVTIVQAEGIIAVTGFGGVDVSGVGLSADISGHTVEIDWEIDDSGQVILVVGELEVSSDENSMEGDLEFTLTGTGGPCSGTFHITAVRQQPLVAGDNPQAAMLRNVHESSVAMVFMRPAGQPSITPICLGSVAPGGTVVFPLPKGSWVVSYTHISDRDVHFETLGVWSSTEEWEDRASSKSGSTGAATSASLGR